MKRLTILIMSLAITGGALFAQSTRDILKQNKALIAGTDYVAPTEELVLTPAPEGYKPCYISHYARHGARYAWRLENYDMIKRALDAAASGDNLTDFGKDYKARFDRLYPDVKDHWGELSRKGWNQQTAIASYIYEAFPEAFPDGARVRAVSSPSLRSVMTMSSYCLALQSKNPTLFVTEDVSRTNMPATLPLEDDNPFYEGYERSTLPFDVSDEQYAAGISFSPEKVLARLFKEPGKSVDPAKFYELATHMFFFAEGMNSLDTDLDFMDLYTDEEAIALWSIDNYQLFTEAWPKHTGYNSIIKDIIARAEAHFEVGECGADLRFAHDYTFMSLMMCLGLEGFGRMPQTPEQVEEVFQSWKIPMGANMHFVFFRSDDDDEILFKVLLNGEEGHLPLPADKWPYYRWSDFKAAH